MAEGSIPCIHSHLVRMGMRLPLSRGCHNDPRHEVELVGGYPVVPAEGNRGDRGEEEEEEVVVTLRPPLRTEDGPLEGSRWLAVNRHVGEGPSGQQAH